MTSPFLKSDLRTDEGLRLRAYPDRLTGGDPWTIGYGHTGDDVGPDTEWTLPHADAMLDADIAHACKLLDFHTPWWRKLCDVRQDVLANMAFNMGWLSPDGRHGLGTFHNTLPLIEAGSYASAATAMAASAWAQQVGERARRLAQQMRTGLRHTP